LPPALSRQRASCRRADALTVADTPCNASSWQRVSLEAAFTPWQSVLSQSTVDPPTCQRAAAAAAAGLQVQQGLLRCCFSSLWRSPPVAPTRAAYLCNCSSHAAASSGWQVDAVARQRSTRRRSAAPTSSAKLQPSRTVDWRHTDRRQADWRHAYW
jgi:hypothetical protein